MDSRMIARYLSITEIAEQLSLSRQTVWREITSGRMRGTKLTERGDWRVSEEALNAWLAQRNSAA